MGLANTVRRVMGKGKLPGGRTVEDWLKESRAARPADYESRVQKVDRYYKGWGRGDVIAALAKMFPLTSSAMQAVQFNVVKLVINEQARVFAGDPMFGLEGADDATLAVWTQTLTDAEAKRKLIGMNRLVRRARRGFMRTTWDAEQNRVRLTRFSPDKVFPIFDVDRPGSWAKAEGVLLELAPHGKTKRFEFWCAGEKPQNFAIDDKDEVAKAENDGINQFENDDGDPIVPVVGFGDEDEDDGYWPCPSETLVDGQEALNGAATHLLHVVKHQGFGQWVIDQTEQNAKGFAGPGDKRAPRQDSNAAAGEMVLQVGPETPFVLPFGRRATHVAQAAPILELVQFMSAMLKQLAVTESIPAGTVLADAKAISGVALLIDRMPLTELRKDQIEVYRRPTREQLDVIRFVREAHVRDGALNGLVPTFTPGEMALPSDPVADATRRQADLRDGLTSAAREIAKRDGVSLEVAKQIAADVQTEQRGARGAALADVGAALRGAGAVVPVAGAKP